MPCIGLNLYLRRGRKGGLIVQAIGIPADVIWPSRYHDADRNLINRPMGVREARKSSGHLGI